MKKVIFKSLFLMLASGILSGTAFSATWPSAEGGSALDALAYGTGVTIPDTNGGGGTISVELSPNVGIRYNSDATAPTGENFALIGLNSQGDRMFGVSSDSSGIFFEAYSDLSSATIPTATDSSTAFSGWNEVGK